MIYEPISKVLYFFLSKLLNHGKINIHSSYLQVHMSSSLQVMPPLKILHSDAFFFFVAITQFYVVIFQ